MIDHTEVRQRPSGGLTLTYPFGVDVLTSMLNRRLLRLTRDVVAGSVAAIQSGEQPLTILYGNSYSDAIGSSTNGSATVAITDRALTITLNRYLDTPAARTVQALISEQVTLSVGLGIAGEAVVEKVLIDGQVFERVVYDRPAMLCEGRVRVASAPGTVVSQRRLV